SALDFELSVQRTACSTPICRAKARSVSLGSGDIWAVTLMPGATLSMGLVGIALLLSAAFYGCAMIGPWPGCGSASSALAGGRPGPPSPRAVRVELQAVRRRGGSPHRRRRGRRDPLRALPHGLADPGPALRRGPGGAERERIGRGPALRPRAGDLGRPACGRRWLRPDARATHEPDAVVNDRPPGGQ